MCCPKFVREGIDAALVVPHEFRRRAAANLFDHARRQSGIGGDRGVHVPFEPGPPECAGDEDRESRKPRLERCSIAADGAECLRSIGECRAVEPYAQRPLHDAARSSDDRVVDALALVVEGGGIDVGQTRHSLFLGCLGRDARRQYRSPMGRANERATGHGGDLKEARRRFPDAPEPWIDLSTGINPIAYPLPPLAPDVWARLPQQSDLRELEAVAAGAYGAAPAVEVVAAPGTQALIQWLPRLFPAKRVGILQTTYIEHALAWRASGASVESVSELATLANFDAGVLVNPNNPDGRLIAPGELRQLAEHLAEKGGLLVIDEAFMDVAPDQSFAAHLPGRGAVI